ncbi:hypothetical protein EVAR_99100_1 [Eumeta japonica]|uniref:Mos1 transposase HTH domain-containing protein n=1 Tax=Eumeta variegata TaxID=151549 RepID=A0A4C1Z670_EUMVA|nr:hypothetical protein EVAR_99100_1 [Eumeta japonica]
MRASESTRPFHWAWLARLRARETDIKERHVPFHSDRNKLSCSKRCFIVRKCIATQQSLARFRTALGNEASCKTSTYNWFAEFKRGRVNFRDEFRDGRPSTAVNNKNIDAVRRMIGIIFERQTSKRTTRDKVVTTAMTLATPVKSPVCCRPHGQGQHIRRKKE